MKCIICIPAYKKELHQFEKISLQQCHKILKSYDKAFVVPESLDINYGDVYQEYKVEKFPDIYFANTRTYSELCLSQEFYERFGAYDYMLIHQLDAFVFSDRLEEFCNAGFDYIGAPLVGGIWESINTYVGNGGFSLRNIKNTLKLLRDHQELLKYSPMSGEFCSGEDVFFSFCGTRKDIDFKVPDIQLAGRFSTQMVMNGDRSTIREKLPFGIHAWARFNYNLWKPIIESYGYQLPSKESVQYVDFSIPEYDWRLYCKVLEKAKELENKCLPFKSCSIWGGGDYGKRCIRVLEALNIKIKCVFDWNIKVLEYAADLDYPVYPPTIANLRENTDMLIVAIRNRDKEITNNIEMLSSYNYIFYDELFHLIEGGGNCRSEANITGKAEGKKAY